MACGETSRFVGVDHAHAGSGWAADRSAAPGAALPSRRYAATYAGTVKLPGLFGVARQAGVRSGLASASARRTPAASKSLA
jgi:hypothetical protein